MSLFGKKKKLEGVTFPYSLALTFGIFLLACLFSICYANPAYNPATGETWQTNPVWLVSFFAGVYGLLFILDVGVKYAFKNKDNEDLAFVPWTYFGLSCAEFAFVLYFIICYFIAYPGVKDGLPWTGRIGIAIAICVLSAFNILIRIPHYVDFKGIFENAGHELISLSLIGALTIIPQLMLLVVIGEYKERDTARAASIFVLVMSIIILLVPFFTTKLLKKREQAHLFSAVSAGAMAVIFFIFLIVYQQHYTQEIDPITYREVYWSAFVYGYSIIVSLGVAAYHGVCVFLLKKH